MQKSNERSNFKNKVNVTIAVKSSTTIYWGLILLEQNAQCPFRKI